jgi:hypothetical protein
MHGAETVRRDNGVAIVLAQMAVADQVAKKAPTDKADKADPGPSRFFAVVL